MFPLLFTSGALGEKVSPAGEVIGVLVILAAIFVAIGLIASAIGSFTTDKNYDDPSNARQLL